MAFPATDQEHRLRALLAAGTAADPVLTAGIEVVSARRSHRFTRFDGNLAGLQIASPAAPGSVTSPTRLERWAVCPLAYLLQDVLRAAPVDNPEEALEITHLDWGNLVHQALERFILEVLERPAAERRAPHQPWPDADRARLLRIGEEVWDGYQAAGLTGRPIFWRRDKARVLTGYPVSANVLAKAGAVLGAMVDGIEHGVFPAHPSTAASTNIWVECRVCDPDDLGVVDLRRAWDRKRHDDALAPYAGLAEPLEAVAPEVEILGDGNGNGGGDRD